MSVLELTRTDRPDTAPDTDVNPDVPTCRECGVELTYSGRGRKPVLCEQHKKGSRRSANAAPKVKGGNATLAAQATEVLVQFDGLTGIMLMLAKFPASASVLAETQEGFREAAYDALVTDPELCRMILKGGTNSAKFALLVAMGMKYAAVFPVFMMEYKAKRDEKIAAREEAAEVA